MINMKRLKFSEVGLIETPFIQSIYQTDFGTDQRLYLYCEFNTREFTDSLYDEYEIFQPNEIARSIKTRSAEFLAGRVLARIVLFKLGLPSSVIRIGNHREPVWPIGFTGSISHSNETCVCCGSIEVNTLVGVDTEKLISSDILHGVIDTSLTVTERHMIRNSSFGDLQRLSTLFFSAKEAVFKAIFPRIKQYVNFVDVEVLEIPTFNVLRLVTKVNLGNRLQKGAVFFVGFQFVGQHVLTWCLDNATTHFKCNGT